MRLERTWLEIPAAQRSCSKFFELPPFWQNCPLPSRFQQRSMVWWMQILQLWKLAKFHTKYMQKPAQAGNASKWAYRHLSIIQQFRIVQGSFMIGMARLTNRREREREGERDLELLWVSKLPGHSRITNSFRKSLILSTQLHSCLQGALKICCISVQQLILQQSMLLPQRTNILIDLWEKVQQPAAKTALSSFQLTIHQETNVEPEQLKGLVQVIVLWYGFDGRLLWGDFFDFWIIRHYYVFVGERAAGAMYMRPSKQWFHPWWLPRHCSMWKCDRFQGSTTRGSMASRWEKPLNIGMLPLPLKVRVSLVVRA